MKEKIGTDAGRLWLVLSEQGPKSVKELKKLTKLKDKEVFAAIGWLAREDKLILEMLDDEMVVSLV
ncbi:hypothetical protein M2138_000152 [Dysgonomonadaceae bacterium PH5-43]|nr:hypothetical protein [Dysgonomonadaceae bacterium PH5-43]